MEGSLLVYSSMRKPSADDRHGASPPAVSTPTFGIVDARRTSAGRQPLAGTDATAGVRPRRRCLPADEKMSRGGGGRVPAYFYGTVRVIVHVGSY